MAYTWKYRVDLGKISAGVFIRTRIFGASTTPDMVRRIPHKIPKATVVWMAFCSSFCCLAPKYLAIITPAPIAIPWKNPTSKKVRLPDELTAASASLPRKFPTIKESAVLYSC